MRIPNRIEKYISYRLNILGIRVWEDRCHLSAKDRSGHWSPLGRARLLPIYLPNNPDGIGDDPLLLTAYQYDMERPGSDLRAVLSQSRNFQQALLDDEGRISRPKAGGAVPAR